jgi:hypothetical protein
MDYVVANSMKRWGKLLETIKLMFMSYDIMCSWSIKWPERLQASPESLGQYVPEGINIKRAIGSWHVHGHLRECLVRYGLAFILGAGALEGEIVETLWAFLNAISAAATAMTTWHRIEVLNDAFNRWNWKKILGIGQPFHNPFDFISDSDGEAVAYLTERWKRALAAYAEHKSALQELMKSIGENSSVQSKVDGWIRQMEHAEELRVYPGTDPNHRNRHPKFLDFYNMKVVRGMIFGSRKHPIPTFDMFFLPHRGRPKRDFDSVFKGRDYAPCRYTWRDVKLD